MLVTIAVCPVCEQQFLGLDEKTVIEKYEKHYKKEHGNGRSKVSVEAVKRGVKSANE